MQLDSEERAELENKREAASILERDVLFVEQIMRKESSLDSYKQGMDFNTQNTQQSEGI